MHIRARSVALGYRITNEFDLALRRTREGARGRASKCERERERSDGSAGRSSYILAKCKRRRTEIIEDANISETINLRTVESPGETLAGALAHRVRRHVLVGPSRRLRTFSFG